MSVGVPREDTLLLGTEEIDLSGVEQVVCRAQARAIVRAIVLAGERLIDGRRCLAEVLDLVEAEVARRGLDALDDRLPGDLAAFRRFELAAALNRLRTLAVRQDEPST